MLKSSETDKSLTSDTLVAADHLFNLLVLFFAIADRNKTIISVAIDRFSDFSLKGGQISGGKGTNVCFERGLVAGEGSFLSKSCLLD